MSGMVRASLNGLRWGMIFSILWLMGVGSVLAIPSKATARQESGHVADKNDPASRVVQHEAPRGAAKVSDNRDQKASPFLAQFYTAEYSTIMARILGWASLQYALFPILVGAFALLAKMDGMPVNLRWWAAIGVLLVGFLAYQGTMLDTLQNVLLIERYLRPLASRLVGSEQFWIHECINRRIQVPNIFYWKYWPPLICVFTIATVTGHIKFRYGLGRWDYFFAVIAFLLSIGVLTLTIQGSWLEQQIIEVCKRNFP